MPIPKINLIPPAYYLRKKVKVATVIAVVAVLAEVAALVAFAMTQSSKNQQLKEQQAYWQDRATKVENTTNEANQALASVSDLTGKTDFVQKVFQSNLQWPAVFESIRNYTYPRVTYTTIKPQAGSDQVLMHIKVPDSKQVRAQQALNLYWANLKRDPMIQAVAPNTMIGYPPSQSGEAGSISLSGPSGGGGMPGGPPMPGGAPMPGGPPMPTSGAPAPRNMYSAISLASPATNAAGERFDVLSGGGTGPSVSITLDQNGMPTINYSQPPTYEFDITAELKKPITIPNFGNAAPEPGQQ